MNQVENVKQDLEEYILDLKQILHQERETKSDIYFKKVINIIKDYFNNLKELGIIKKVQKYRNDIEEKIKWLHKVHQVFYNDREDQKMAPIMQEVM